MLPELPFGLIAYSSKFKPVAVMASVTIIDPYLNFLKPLRRGFKIGLLEFPTDGHVSKETPHGRLGYYKSKLNPAQQKARKLRNRTASRSLAINRKYYVISDLQRGR